MKESRGSRARSIFKVEALGGLEDRARLQLTHDNRVDWNPETISRVKDAVAVCKSKSEIQMDLCVLCACVHVGVFLRVFLATLTTACHDVIVIRQRLYRND